MRKLVWSEAALADFIQAISYIAEQEPRAAALIADRIDAAATQLAELPIGRPGRVLGTYEKLARRKPYVIAYALSEQTITILRVIHGARDWPADDWPDE